MSRFLLSWEFLLLIHEEISQGGILADIYHSYNYPPQAGNYANWGLAEAALMLLLTALAYVQHFIPKRVLPWRPKWLLWLYDGFLPAFTLTYFFWNLADIITLKISNKPTLIEDNENKVSGFGQVVPVALLLLPLLALRDLWGDE